MNKIQPIIDSLISFKLAQLSDVEQTRGWINSIGRHAFARELSTIQLNLGRMSGHTTAIIKNASSCDLIFTINQRMADMMYRDYGKYALSANSNFDHRFRGRNEFHRYVWIDGASFIEGKHIDRIYDLVLMSARDYVPLFILLG